MEDEPYLLDRPDDPGPPPRLVPHPCPYAPEGEDPAALRPRGLADVLRAVAALGPDAPARCLLLAPGAPGPWLTPEPRDLRAWARRAEEAWGRPVRALAPGAPCPCGQAPACRAHPNAAAHDARRRLDALATRQDTLTAAFDQRLGALPERGRRLVQDWAHLPDPNRPNHPIPVAALAKRHRISDRQAFRLLAQAKDADPAFFALLKRLRDHRLRPNRAYEVRDDSRPSDWL